MAILLDRAAAAPSARAAQRLGGVGSSVERDVGAAGLALAPAYDSERREEGGAKKRESDLHVGLSLLAGGAVVLVLLLDRVVVVAGLDLGPRDIAVGQIGFAQEFGARRNEIGIAAHPVERVLERKNGAGEVLLRVGTGDHLQLLVAADRAHHRKLSAHLHALTRARKRVGEEARRRDDEHSALVLGDGGHLDTIAGT